MKKSPESTKMVTSVQMSGDKITDTDLDKLALFSLNDNNNCSEDLNEINQVLILLFSKIQTYGTHLEVENKHLEDKCVSLEAKVQDLSKPCAQCIKYKQDIDNFTIKNESSNKVLFDSDADSRSSPPKNVQLDVDISRIVKSLITVKSPNDEKAETFLAKTPPSKRSDRDRDTSPVVQKQLRSGKRSKLSLSANKKYRFDKDGNKLNADLFSELPDALLDDNGQQGITVKSDPVENETKSISSGITISDETVLSDSSIIEPSPTPVIKHRRSKKPNPFLDGKYNAFECVNDDTTLTPVSVNVLENNPAPGPFEKNNDQDDTPKAKWDLKKLRDVSSKNSKFKQTTLGTAFIKKPKDISTSNTYKGGVASNATLNSIPEDMEMTLVNKVQSRSSSDKENAPIQSPNNQEPIFYDDRTKKKKSSMLIDPSAKVNEIFFSSNKSNDRNKKQKIERDASQETIFNEDVSAKEKRFPVSGPNTALQETFFQFDKPNDEKRDVEVNTALQETFFTLRPNDGIENSPETTNRKAFPPVETNTKIKSDTELDTALQETFFNPCITSTVNQLEPEKKTTPKKIKPKPVELPKNSFDFLPSPDSPKYKYRRDALRKKADRQKLPGWECPTCVKFYLDGKDKLTETQMELIRKCSRHRDKYPIYSNTPPGIWNPKFDSTDESD